MALLELIGRLGLNTKPFEDALGHAKRKARSEGSEIGKAFQHVGLGLLGIHGLSRTLTHMIDQTIEWSKDIDKAREQFDRLGIAIDEGALRSIKETGIELERLKVVTEMYFAKGAGWFSNYVDKISSIMARAMVIGRGVTKGREWMATATANIERNEAERANAIYGPDLAGQKKFEEDEEKKFGPLREQLAKLKEKNLLEEMTTEEKLAYKLDSYLLFLEGTARPGRLGRLKDQIEEQMLLGEIQGLQKGEIDPTAALPKLSHGSLAHIGGFSGLVMSDAQNPAKTLADISKNTESTVQAIDRFKEWLQSAGLNDMPL